MKTIMASVGKWPLVDHSHSRDSYLIAIYIERN